MKQRINLLILFSGLVSGVAVAQDVTVQAQGVQPTLSNIQDESIDAKTQQVQVQSQQGGFKGPKTSKPIQTVKQALDAKDDTQITVSGYILESLGDDEYTFKDETGEIVIEVDNEVWRGVTVTPKTKVILSGEVDNEVFSKPTLDISMVELAH